MITENEIKKTALLAKLSVSTDELEALAHDLTKIIEFADTINGAPKSGEFEEVCNLSGVMRSDEVKESYPREEILLNADGGENGFFSALKK